MPSLTYLNLPIEKKERIMLAVTHEMGVHSYESLNLANIIRDANISRGSFYQYFEDKNDLALYFYQYIGEKKIAYFGDLYNIEHDIPFFDRFKKLYTSAFKFGFENPLLLKVAKKIATSDHFLNSSMMSQSTHQVNLMFASLIKHDQNLGRIKKTVDPELLSAFLIEFTSKISLEAYFQNEVDYLVIEKKIQNLIEMLQKGIEQNV